MKKQRLVNLFLTCGFGFLGGVFSQQFFSSGFAIAAGEQLKAFADSSGLTRLDIGVYNDSPVQDFYGEDGKPRIQLGTYTEEGEKGLPLAAFADNNGNIRLLLRLAGQNQSPVIIMKDSKGSDRIVMGLSLSDESEDPFLTYTDKNGTHTLFGGTSPIAH